MIYRRPHQGNGEASYIPVLIPVMLEAQIKRRWPDASIEAWMQNGSVYVGLQGVGMDVSEEFREMMNRFIEHAPPDLRERCEPGQGLKGDMYYYAMPRPLYEYAVGMVQAMPGEEADVFSRNGKGRG